MTLVTDGCKGMLQVDALRPGLLGKDRAAFAYRYCNRRLIPVGRQGSNTKKFDNSGLSRAGELHALLKEVSQRRKLLQVLTRLGTAFFTSSFDVLYELLYRTSAPSYALALLWEHLRCMFWRCWIFARHADGCVG